MIAFAPRRVGREAMLALYGDGCDGVTHRFESDVMTRTTGVILAQHGLIKRAPRGNRPRIVVSLTDAGRAMCRAWVAEGKTVQS